MAKEKHVTKTAFWNLLMQGIYGPRQGGARIIIDAEDAKTGAGKTSAMVYLGRLLDSVFGYGLTKQDATISGGAYLNRYQEHPGEEQPSIICVDELSGGGAADARRAMSTGNVQLARAWELMRQKRIVTITTLPHWGDADSKLQKLADFRLHCQKRPIGSFIAYEIGASFDRGNARTRGLPKEGLSETIHFPDLTEIGDPIYEKLTTQKDELMAEGGFDADAIDDKSDEEEVQDPEDAKREQKIETVIRLVKPWIDDRGVTYQEAADAVDMSKGWVAERLNEWRDGEFRWLVNKPGAKTHESAAT